MALPPTPTHIILYHNNIVIHRKRIYFKIFLFLTIPDNCHNPHNLGWCTFFKPAYLFPQRTRKGLLLGKFIQRIKTQICTFFCDEKYTKQKLSTKILSIVKSSTINVSYVQKIQGNKLFSHSNRVENTAVKFDPKVYC